jgi:oxygen-independent coproporphyrinogen-3 oxidase
VDPRLITKYDRPGPRYTSYPPVPFWSGRPEQDIWVQDLLENYDPLMGLDLYVHIPYCEKLCYYCGCNRTITKNHTVEGPLLELIMGEWDIYRRLLGTVPKINSLHFGGGTPTFLNSKNLETLIRHLSSERTLEFIGSIELDPRTCTQDHLKVLAETEVTRVSIGVQDFSPKVQEAINRIQPVKMVKDLVDSLRAMSFKSINMDLIYGLPLQDLDTITTTMKTVAEMRPDLIAFYGYAHLPEKIKNQRLINETHLPSPLLRRSLYEKGKELLALAGYDDIGLDHFALPGSHLYEAKQDGKLHRNFMGYVDKKSPVLLGLGPTSISNSSKSFAQNAKDIKEYAALISSGLLPLAHGHSHSAEDLEAQEVILGLMCEGRTRIKKHKLPSWENIEAELLEFQADGIITLENDVVAMTTTGQGLVRNVAMTFDHHLRMKSKETRFSQTV